MTDLRITATDASTVFTGAANVHRFDAPSSREIAGTIKTVLGPNPAGAAVHISADQVRLRELEYALADYDIDLTTDILDTAPAPLADDPPTDSFPPIEHHSNGSVWVVAVIVALVAAVVAAAIYFTVRGGDDAPAEVEAEAKTEAEAQPETEARPVPEVVSSTSEAAPQTVLLEQDGLRVELPAGFALEADDGTWRATGEDPNFRLHIAVEHLYQLPAQTMAEQLLADIEADPETELVDTDGTAVTYLERASDGSQALWKTWPHGQTQLFVGCHTRAEPTNVQRATCRMAMESAEYQGADVPT